MPRTRSRSSLRRRLGVLVGDGDHLPPFLGLGVVELARGPRPGWRPARPGAAGPRRGGRARCGGARLSALSTAAPAAVSRRDTSAALGLLAAVGPSRPVAIASSPLTTPTVSHGATTAEADHADRGGQPGADAGVELEELELRRPRRAWRRRRPAWSAWPPSRPRRRRSGRSRRPPPAGWRRGGRAPSSGARCGPAARAGRTSPGRAAAGTGSSMPTSVSAAARDRSTSASPRDVDEQEPGERQGEART